MRKFIKGTSVCTLLLFFATLFTCQIGANEVEAANSITLRNVYKEYVTCTLVNKKKGGNVKVIVWPAKSYKKTYVKLTDTSGRYVWEGTMGWNGQRTFFLGNDHSGYRVYVRSDGGSGITGSVNFQNAGNISIR